MMTLIGNSMHASSEQLRETLRFTEQYLGVRSEDDVKSSLPWLNKIIDFDSALIINVKLGDAKNPSITSMVPYFSGNESHPCDIDLIKSSNLLNTLTTTLSEQKTFKQKCQISCSGNSLISGISNTENNTATAVVLMNKQNTDFSIQNQIVDYVLPHIDSAISRYVPNNSINLSDRQLQVLEWISMGKSNWEVASILNVSENTIKFHVTNICKKLNVHKRCHAISVASKLRLVNR